MSGVIQCRKRTASAATLRCDIDAPVTKNVNGRTVEEIVGGNNVHENLEAERK